MVAVGSTDTLWTNLSVLATGVARDYADTAAFLAAGYALTWYDEDGVALASQPTYSLIRSETNGDHLFQYEVPLGAFAVRMTVPATDYASIALWNGRGYSYSIDDLGGMIASTGSVVLSETATSTEYVLYDGDSVLAEGIVIPEAALTAIGAASLAACDSRKAFIKLSTADSNDAPTVPDTDLTVSITTDASNNRVVAVTCDNFPNALGVPDDTTSVSAVLMVVLTEGTKQITAAVVQLTIRWTADTGEYP